nr:hypothetical protein [uncultured Catonella sp.]
MINIILLGLLALIDFIKKEIHIFILLPVITVWLSISIWNNESKMQAILAAILLIGLSIVTKQAFGMADAIVLSLIALENGIFNMLIIFFTANIIFLIFAVIKFGFKQKNREIPFIPFIFISFILLKLC